MGAEHSFEIKREVPIKSTLWLKWIPPLDPLLKTKNSYWFNSLYVVAPGI